MKKNKTKRDNAGSAYNNNNYSSYISRNNIKFYTWEQWNSRKGKRYKKYV